MMIMMKNKNFIFKVVNEIKTKQRPRARVVNGAFAQIYTPKSTASYENLIKTIYQNLGGPFFGSSPLKVTIKACFAPSQEYKKYIDQGFVPLCTNQKDLDNIAKTILDALNGIAYKDDKQVYELEIRKCYSKENQDYVMVEITSSETGSVEVIKEQFYNQKLCLRKAELEAKPKLTKQEEKRLEEIEKKLNDSRLRFEVDVW